MIRDLDDTMAAVLQAGAPAKSRLAGADIKFDLPDAAWRGGLSRLTVNCYLFDIHESRELRTNEPLVARSADKQRAARIAPPVRISCSYCITAWSTAANDAVLEEHELLSDVLLVLLRNETIARPLLRGKLATQIPPYPTVIAHAGEMKHRPEFWNALDQKLKPSLNYVVTLAFLLEDEPADPDKSALVTTLNVHADNKAIVDKGSSPP